MATVYTTKSKLKVRLISPWQTYAETENAIFSVDIPTDKADALLCEWAPSAELFTFPRRKAWYCCEPQCQFRALGGGVWPKIKANLGPHEFMWHGHPDSRYRVPHITHFEPLVINTNPNRLDKAVAIVSNHGGSPWRRHPDITYRNKIITDPRVELYGRLGWNGYRARWYSRRAAPSNYKGEIPGDWPAGEKRELMSKYKVAICMENTSEPNYFTEKFVEAVVAGCVPVYAAERTVMGSFLDGALWVDPANCGGTAQEAIASALDADWSMVLSQNKRWLEDNKILQGTCSAAVFEKIGAILVDA